MLTKEQWAAVEQSLSYPHGNVELECDGRKVTAEVRACAPLKFSVMVFVDGWARGEWMRADKPCDQQRFYNPHEKALFTAADLKRARKVLLARQVREMEARKYRWFSLDFPTAKALRRRLSSTCKSIRLVDTSDARVERLIGKQERAMVDALVGDSPGAMA